MASEQDQFPFPQQWLQPLSQLGFTGNFDYSYGSDSADNLTTIRGVMQSVNNVNQITGDALGSNYRYDADGNTTAYNIYVPPSRAPGGVISNSLTYDDEGRLTSFNNTSVGYRPDGLRGWANGHYYFYAGGKLL